MCIRDRYTSSQLADVAAEVDVRLSVGRTGVCWDNAQQESLSLIHISEPHETVLDLVCRLLLEKKNSTKYSLTS